MINPNIKSPFRIRDRFLYFFHDHCYFSVNHQIPYSSFIIDRIYINPDQGSKRIYIFSDPSGISLQIKEK